MNNFKGIAHTFLVVIACIAVYNMVLKPVVPTTIQSWIGI